MSRCDYHRNKDGPYHEVIARKRETPRHIFNKAVEEGRDPVEAIKEFLLWEEEKNQWKDTDGEGEGVGKGKARRKRRRAMSIEPSETNPSDEGGVITQRMRRIEGVTICAGKNCQNLLRQEVSHVANHSGYLIDLT